MHGAVSVGYKFANTNIFCCQNYCFFVEREDFVPTEVTLVWHYDSLSLTQCVSVAIINDECVEEKEEVFTVSLSTEEECVDIGADNQTTVTILDDDRELEMHCSF